MQPFDQTRREALQSHLHRRNPHVRFNGRPNQPVTTTQPRQPIRQVSAISDKIATVDPIRDAIFSPSRFAHDGIPSPLKHRFQPQFRAGGGENSATTLALQPPQHCWSELFFAVFLLVSPRQGSIVAQAGGSRTGPKAAARCADKVMMCGGGAVKRFFLDSGFRKGDRDGGVWAWLFRISGHFGML